MLLCKLLKVDSDIEISGIGFGDKCEKGDLYFCLHGERDAHFASERCAKAIVTEYNVPSDLPEFLCGDVRHEFACASAKFYGNPADGLTMIGVTGTNGKTTTTHIIKSILEADGKSVGLIGTIGSFIGEERYNTSLTTPDPPELHKTLAEMKKRGVTHVVIEVSAHALALKKLDGIKFGVSAFTNLSQDHLDFFGDIETYEEVKSQLFMPTHSTRAVVNMDDFSGMKIARNALIPTITYGIDNPSDVFGIDYFPTTEGASFIANVMDEIIPLRYCLPGKYNMYNVLCAATVANMLGVSPLAIQKGVNGLKSVSGRFETYKAKGKRIVIDYAHTPDGLEKVLTAARETTCGKVIVVFGCGGDRDKLKRPLMGSVAEKYADYAIITDDNPRGENADEIVKQIASGFSGNSYMIIGDRHDAIKYAVDLCHADDVVIIAGKGHETTIEKANGKTPYSDAETVKELLS